MEETIRSCGTISWYSPPFQPSCPSGDLMQQRNFPPTRKSILQTGAVKPLGPHHCITYFGFVHASQTNARGASKILVITIRSFSLTAFFVISDLRFFLFSFAAKPHPTYRNSLPRIGDSESPSH